MKWVYILKCKDDFYYVGETKRLYRRFWEHTDGIGGVNTSIYTPEGIVAIYKVGTICKFLEYNEYVNNIIDGVFGGKYQSLKLKAFNDEYEESQYDNLYAENNVTECLMIHNEEDWNKIRGGKYTRFDVEYKFPENNYIKDLPLCNCGLPCDIKKNEDKNYLFFRCAKKNMWDKFKQDFDINDQACDFFMEYTKDKKIKIEEQYKFQERSKTLKELFKKSNWLKNIELNDDCYPNQCVGGCNRSSASIKLTFSNKKRNLCFDCFIDKNIELKEKYNIVDKKEYLDIKECLFS
jgi:hypothetical protein